MEPEVELTPDVFEVIRIKDILVDSNFNCRGEIDPGQVVRLAEDIKARGLIQPIVVRLPKESDPKTHKYLLVAGFRRIQAFKLLLRTEISAKITEMTYQEALFTNFAENIQREDLSIMQEALTIARLLRIGVTKRQIAEKLNQSTYWVRVRTMLLSMEEYVQSMANVGILTPQNILDLYAIKDPDERRETAKFIRKKRDKGWQGDIKIERVHERAKAIVNRAQLKKARSTADIQNLFDFFLCNSVPFGLHTRCLAWVTGTITDDELLQDIEHFCAVQTIDFVRPKNGIPNMRNSLDD